MIEDLFLPNEEIKYRRNISNLSVGGERFEEMVITNHRILFYKRTGLIFKNDVIETIGLDSITGVKYREKGMISKKGIVEIHGEEMRRMEGSAAQMKQLYQVLSSKSGKLV